MIDTGIDYTHPDLAANMFRNNADCNSNGIDDDGNGFVDDCYGFDTVNNDSNPMDDHGHGTHVAGTIGAVGNNGVGVVGVNWTVRLMACKFLDASGRDRPRRRHRLSRLRQDDEGPRREHRRDEQQLGRRRLLAGAVRRHRRAAAARHPFHRGGGQRSSNNDTTAFYPAELRPAERHLGGGDDAHRRLASFSNYGRRTVHLGAPGIDILSTTPNNSYGTFSGTSMATPHVTGVAALLKAQAPGAMASDQESDPRRRRFTPALANTMTSRRLNAYGALTCTNRTVVSRLKPVATTGAVGIPVTLSALNINCASPNGNVTVWVEPGYTSVRSPTTARTAIRWPAMASTRPVGSHRPRDVYADLPWRDRHVRGDP